MQLLGKNGVGSEGSVVTLSIAQISGKLATMVTLTLSMLSSQLCLPARERQLKLHNGFQEEMSSLIGVLI